MTDEPICVTTNPPAEPPGHDLPPALRALAMPSDTNPNGDIFGGWVLGQMDLAGGVTAARRAGGRVVTVGIEAMSFHRPVYVGDEMSCYCTIERVGRSSLRVKIDNWVRRYLTGEAVKVTEGVFTYVAVGADGRPRPVPPLEEPAPAPAADP